MTGKELLLGAIHRQEIPRLPLMYRAHPEVSERLLRHFGLGDLERDWQTLAGCLGADNYSDGETLGAFTSYVPRYLGPEVDCIQDVDHFFVWGIKPVKRISGGMVELEFHHAPHWPAAMSSATSATMASRGWSGLISSSAGPWSTHRVRMCGSRGSYPWLPSSNLMACFRTPAC